MESHPSYSVLASFLSKYPHAAPSLFQTYNDIVYAQQWKDVEVIELHRCQRAAIRGKKKDSDLVTHVVPCSLPETLSFAWLQNAFTELSYPSQGASNPTSPPESAPMSLDDKDPPFLYLAITSQDASIVYYKLSQGIVKPPV